MRRPLSLLVPVLALAAGFTLAPAAMADEASNPTAGRGHEEVISDSDEDVPGEIAVDVRDDVSDADLADLESTYGLHPNSAWSHAHDKLEIVTVPLADESALLDKLSHDPRVEGAEP